MKKVTPDELKKYHFFMDGTGWNTAPFEVFAKDFKRFVEQNLPDDARLLEFSTNHYVLSGFIEKDYRFVYFSTSDVRVWKDWYNAILVRTAKSDHDHTGGSNGYTSLENFGEKVKELLGISNEEEP